MFRLLSILSLAALIAAPVAAQSDDDLSRGLSTPVEELVAEALARSPDLAAARYRHTAALEMERPAAALADPTVVGVSSSAALGGVTSETFGRFETSATSKPLSWCDRYAWRPSSETETECRISSPPLVDRPASLYGLGIPPSQYKALAGDEAMSDVLHARLEKLACDFPLQDNYFAQQAFGRRYMGNGDSGLPPYLVRANFKAVRANAGRVAVRHMSFTDFLVTAPHTSLDRYVLLDAQDWMTDEALTRLWTQITRTARPGARVIFRTAAPQSLLPGRLPIDLLQRWSYQADLSVALSRKDRSAIYGGFHLYIVKN